MALLTLTRAWYANGSPRPKNVPNLASFTRWAKTIGGILEYIGIEGFLDNRAKLRADANQEEELTDVFLHAWLDHVGTDWISAKTLVGEITKNTAENTSPANELTSPANELAETLPDSLKDALSDRRKNGTLVLSRWLEKRVKTPYGRDNIRIERTREKHSRKWVWRVVQVSAGEPTASSQKNAKKSSVDTIPEDTDGNVACTHLQEAVPSPQESAPNGSTRPLSSPSPREPVAGDVQFAGDVQSLDNGRGTKQSPAIGSPALTPGRCLTRFEKAGKKVAHIAEASQIVAGYAWCHRCTAQQQWMAYGQAHDYPRITVSGERGFVVKAGPDEWFRFACHAGYAMVEQAVRAIAPQAALSAVPDPLRHLFRDLIQPWCEQRGPIALDLETTGLDCRSERVISITIGTPGNVTVLDMRPYYSQTPERQALIKQQLSTLFHQEGITWVGHNLKFDWAFLCVHFDLKLRQVYDTMLAEQVRLADSHQASSLQETAKRSGLTVTKEQRAWFEGLDKRQAEWSAPFPEAQERYMIQDACVAYQIYERQRPHLEKQGLLSVVRLENDALPAIAAMEVHGVLIDQARWRAILQEKSERALLIEKELAKTLGQARHDAGHSTEASRAAKYAAYQQALQVYEKQLMQEYRSVQGKRTWSDYHAARLRDWQKTHPDPGQPKAVSSEINLRSSAQLLEALHALGLDVTDTSEEVLQEYEPRSPVVASLLAWRKLDHFVTAFGEKLLAHVSTSGRIHANFNQVRAVSGRIICRQPNLQQIPRTHGDTAEDIRQCFVAPEGSRILTADLSNIELRILAEFSDDETMLRLFAQDLDLHAETAKLMFHLPPETNTKEHLSNGVPVRDIGKCINFGLAYGMGARGLAKQINVEVDAARELIQRYAATYKGVATWLRQTAQQAIAQGYATTPLGRKRFFQTENLGKAERGSLERSAKNHPIQATNADILKRALCLLFHALPEGVHLVLVVHDEIVPCVSCLAGRRSIPDSGSSDGNRLSRVSAHGCSPRAGGLD